MSTSVCCKSSRGQPIRAGGGSSHGDERSFPNRSPAPLSLDQYSVWYFIILRHFAAGLVEGVAIVIWVAKEA